MSKIHSASKILMIIACLAMVFALSAGVSALDYNKEYNTSYSIGSGTTAAVDVLVTIESDSSGLPFTVVPVHLNSSSSPHMVLDALLSSDIAAAGFSFYNAGTPLSATSTYFDSIKYNNVYYTGNGTGYSGWCFRINGGFPQQSPGWGASIATAPIDNGDVIAIYLDDPIAQNKSTRFTRATVDSATANAVQVTVTESHQSFGPGPNYTWNITNFAPIGGLTVKLYSGMNISGTPIATTTSLSLQNYEGKAYFNNLSLSPGTYSIVVCGNYNTTPPISSCITTFTIQ